MNDYKVLLYNAAGLSLGTKTVKAESLEDLKSKMPDYVFQIIVVGPDGKAKNILIK